MTDQLTRRTALASVTTAPLLAVATPAKAANATDAAWANYQTARTARRAAERELDNIDAALPPELRAAALPGALHGGPACFAAYREARLAVGANAAGDVADAATDRECRAEMTVVQTSVASLIDFDRKLAILADYLDPDDWPSFVVAQLRSDVVARDPGAAGPGAGGHQSSPA